MLEVFVAMSEATIALITLSARLDRKVASSIIIRPRNTILYIGLNIRDAL